VELFSEKISAGKRTYFLDVKKSREGIQYLTISESQRKQDGKYEHTRVMVFQENIQAFVEAFHNAIAVMGFRQGVDSYVNEIRKTLPNAYRPLE